VATSTATSTAPSRPDSGDSEPDSSAASTSDATTVGSPAPPPPPSARVRSFAVPVGVAVLAGFALRVAIGLTDDAPSTDETAYLRSGISLIEGDGFERSGHPELHFPPFVPFLLGLASRVVDAHVGAVVLTCVAGTALILPLALLARRLVGPGAGVVTAWVAALAPGLATMPAARGAGSEAEYALLVVTALWLVVSAADHRGRPRLIRVAGAGLLIGLAYLTRPEGLFLALPLGAAVVALAFRRVRRGGGTTETEPEDDKDEHDDAENDERSVLARLGQATALAAAFAAPLVLCIAPYAAFLHSNTGKWELTAKTQDASIEAWHAVAGNDRESRDEVLYELDDSGLRFSDAATDRTPLPTLAREDPAGYAGILLTNLASLGKNVGGWWLLPVPAWVLAGLGAWRMRRSRLGALLLVVGLVPVATAMAFFVQPRYLMVTVALATVLVGAAWSRLSGRWRWPILAGTVGMLALSSVATFYGDGGWWHPGDHTDQRRAGEWVAAHTDPDDRIMARSMVVEYYADRPTIAVPYADAGDITRFARHYGVRYLVVDESHASRLRPQLLPLLGTRADAEAEASAVGLRLVHEVWAEGRITRVFALDPPPRPSTEAGPRLGFMGDGPG
jgi:4-amino-4-deoxy-L-arabinose transferase-like glycosyltransferase